MNDSQNDHDLLIAITTKLDRAILDIKELKDNTTARVTALEQEKANQKDFDEHKKSSDKAIASLQKLVYIGLGILLTIQFVLILYVTLHHS